MTDLGAAGAPGIPPLPNGSHPGAQPSVQPSRRSTDRDDADYRWRRESYRNGNGDGGGNGSRGPLGIGAIGTIGAAVGAIVTVLGVVQYRLDPVIVDLADRITQVRGEIADMKSGARRTEDWLRNEIARLDQTKVNTTTRIEMLADLNRRLERIEAHITGDDQSERSLLAIVAQIRGDLQRLRDRVEVATGQRQRWQQPLPEDEFGAPGDQR